MHKADVIYKNPSAVFLFHFFISLDLSNFSFFLFSSLPNHFFHYFSWSSFIFSTCCYFVFFFFSYFRLFFFSSSFSPDFSRAYFFHDFKLLIPFIHVEDFVQTIFSIFFILMSSGDL